jgi:hypothetical protein
MNMHAFTSPELDVIYDALVMHMQCTDYDEDARVCNIIIDKMHTYCIMNEKE